MNVDQHEVVRQFIRTPANERTDYILALDMADREWILMRKNIDRFLPEGWREQLAAPLEKLRLAECDALTEDFIATEENERANFLLALPEKHRTLFLKQKQLFTFIPKEDHIRLLKDEAFMSAYLYLVFDELYALQNQVAAKEDKQPTEYRLHEVMQQLSFEALLYLGSEEFYARRCAFDDYPEDLPRPPLKWSAMWEAMWGDVALPEAVWAKHLDGGSDLEKAIQFTVLAQAKHFSLSPQLKRNAVARMVFGRVLPKRKSYPHANLDYAVLDASRYQTSNGQRSSKSYQLVDSREATVPEKMDATRLLSAFTDTRISASVVRGVGNVLPFWMQPDAMKINKTLEGIKQHLQTHPYASLEELFRFLLDERQTLLDHYNGEAIISVGEDERVAGEHGRTMELMNKWIVKLLHRMLEDGVAHEKLLGIAKEHQADSEIAVQINRQKDYGDRVKDGLMRLSPVFGYSISSNKNGWHGANSPVIKVVGSPHEPEMSRRTYAA